VSLPPTFYHRTGTGTPHTRRTSRTNMATLQQLQTTCLSLLFSTQAHPVGFAKLSIKPETSLSSEEEEHLLGLYDKLEKVCLERRILEAEMSGVGIEGGFFLPPPFFSFSPLFPRFFLELSAPPLLPTHIPKRSMIGSVPNKRLGSCKTQMTTSRSRSNSASRKQSCW